MEYNEYESTAKSIWDGGVKSIPQWEPSKCHPSDVNLIEDINATNPDLVIDMGCGTNFFKGRIQNVIGYDISDIEGPDYIASTRQMWEDKIFEESSADYIFCYGPLAFGDEDFINEQIGYMKYWAKPNAYILMRVPQPLKITDDIKSNYNEYIPQKYDKFSVKNGNYYIRGQYVQAHYFWTQDKIVEAEKLFGFSRRPDRDIEVVDYSIEGYDPIMKQTLCWWWNVNK